MNGVFKQDYGNYSDLIRVTSSPPWIVLDDTERFLQKHLSPNLFHLWKHEYRNKNVSEETKKKVVEKCLHLRS